MNFDEQLYSRQIVAFGFNAMNELSKLKILIYRIGGLGIEIAKNIILAGPKKVTICDNKQIGIEDLGSNFYINEKDLGLRRDEVCFAKLKELNNNIDLEILKEENFEDNIKEYEVIVITDILELEKIMKINEICRENKIGFIYCLSLGLSFYCFVDFCEHTIKDLYNKEKKKYFIKNIIKGEKTKIIIDNGLENFSLSINNHVIFKEIKGITELMDGKKRKIALSNKNYFEIKENSLKYEDYIEGGIVEEARDPMKLYYKSLKEMLISPKFCEYMTNENKNINLHMAFLLIHEYFKKFKKFPEKNIINIKLTFKKIYEKIYKKNNELFKNIILDEDFIYFIFINSKYQICPINSYGGGVVSQEIIKYVGLYKPINQWFSADFVNIIDKNIIDSKSQKGSRYDDQISLFGENVQKNLQKLNVFLIGAGAVGCELLKNFAMMGVSTNKNSKLIVTDHDRIEKSNLSRQFLFRNNDILKLKAECAIKAIKKMNGKMNCEYYQNYVSEKTQKIFNKKFFKKQDVVVMAVDSFEARNYISQKCEEYGIPYFNCGTDGPYANVEAFIPGITEPPSYPINYKKIVPSCTLKMFPSSINHCVSWAYNHFEKYFNENIKNLNILYNDKNTFYKIMNRIQDLNSQYNKLKKIFKLIKMSYAQQFDNCIKLSFKKYCKLFIHNINNILKLHPSGKIIAKTGEKFWSGNKRLPHPLTFDLNDNMCHDFITSFSCLLAKCLNINIPKKNITEYIKTFCSTLKIKSLKEKEFKEKSYYEKKILEIKEKINIFLKNNKINKNYNPINYDKDSDDIYQIDFISNCSNLRARNYNIEQEGKFKINTIAGKIIPAIITSTSSIAGLLSLQLFVICQNKDYKTFMTGIINLSDNSLALGIPLKKIEDDNSIKKSNNNITLKKSLSLIKINFIIKILLIIIFFKLIFK